MRRISRHERSPPLAGRLPNFSKVGAGEQSVNNNRTFVHQNLVKCCRQAFIKLAGLVFKSLSTPASSCRNTPVPSFPIPFPWIYRLTMSSLTCALRRPSLTRAGNELRKGWHFAFRGDLGSSAQWRRPKIMKQPAQRGKARWKLTGGTSICRRKDRAGRQLSLQRAERLRESKNNPNRSPPYQVWAVARGRSADQGRGRD
jgi:hypothetical protein